MDKSKISLVDVIQALPSYWTDKRPDTIRTYCNQIKHFTEYLQQEQGLQHLSPNDFTQIEAIRYLDYITAKRGISGTTRNNYGKAMKSFFFMMKKRGYLDRDRDNPFTGLDNALEEEKERGYFTQAEASLIMRFTVKHHLGVYLGMALAYYCAVRRTEIRRLQIKDMDFERKVLLLPGRKTKTRQPAVVSLPDPLFELVKGYKRYPKEYYLLGGRDLSPASVQHGTNRLYNLHLQTLKVLETYQMIKIGNRSFYSWRDSAGIHTLENGGNILDIKRHYRHTDIQTSYRYIQKYGRGETENALLPNYI